jgi:hypothetical protein
VFEIESFFFFRVMYFIQMLNDQQVRPKRKIVPAFVAATLLENNYRLVLLLLCKQFENFAFEKFSMPYVITTST